MKTTETIYVTGLTSAGVPLYGGVWTHWHQNGFPLELSHIHVRGIGGVIDWIEAMADASLTHNLPALVEAVCAFLPAPDLAEIKIRFTAMLRAGQSYETILAGKRRSAARLMAAMEILPR